MLCNLYQYIYIYWNSIINEFCLRMVCAVGVCMLSGRSHWPIEVGSTVCTSSLAPFSPRHPSPCAGVAACGHIWTASLACSFMESWVPLQPSQPSEWAALDASCDDQYRILLSNQLNVMMTFWKDEPVSRSCWCVSVWAGRSGVLWSVRLWWAGEWSGGILGRTDWWNWCSLEKRSRWEYGEYVYI